MKNSYSKDNRRPFIDSKKINVIRDIQSQFYGPAIQVATAPISGIANRSNTLLSFDNLPLENKFDKLYTLISNKFLLIQALGNISSNKGSLTPGTDSSTYDVSQGG